MEGGHPKVRWSRSVSSLARTVRPVKQPPDNNIKSDKSEKHYQASKQNSRSDETMEVKKSELLRS